MKKKPAAKKQPVVPVKKPTAQASCCHRARHRCRLLDTYWTVSSDLCLHSPQEKSFEPVVVNRKTEQARRRSSRYPVTTPNPPHAARVSVPRRETPPIGTFRALVCT